MHGLRRGIALGGRGMLVGEGRCGARGSGVEVFWARNMDHDNKKQRLDGK